MNTEDEKMKAYVLEAVNRLEYKEVDIPQLKQGEVLVEVCAAGICGSDIPRIFTTGTYHFPTIPGHEFSGKVIQAYDEAGQSWIGKRVGIFPLIPCKECTCCQKEKYEMCSNYNYLGSRCNGGFAEYVAVPIWNLIELPEAVSYEEAAMLEPASVSLHALRQINLEGVSTVALFGLGTIGIIIAQWLHIHGVKTLFTTGHNSQHGELMQKVTSFSYDYIDAREQDIVEQILNKTRQNGVDVVIDCVGSSQSLTEALNCVRPGGQILIVANPKGNLELDKNTYWKILRRQIRITGTWNSTFTHSNQDDWHTVLKACEKGQLHLKELITHLLPFDELHQGLEIMQSGKEYRNKVMICKRDIFG